MLSRMGREAMFSNACPTPLRKHLFSGTQNHLPLLFDTSFNLLYSLVASLCLYTREWSWSLEGCQEKGPRPRCLTFRSYNWLASGSSALWIFIRRDVKAECPYCIITFQYAMALEVFLATVWLCGPRTARAPLTSRWTCGLQQMGKLHSQESHMALQPCFTLSNFKRNVFANTSMSTKRLVKLA